MAQTRTVKAPKPRHPIVGDWGASVGRRRKQLGWTQDQLADEASVPQQTISRMENGTFSPSLEMWLRVCVALCAEPADLFAWPKLRDLAVAS